MKSKTELATPEKRVRPIEVTTSHMARPRGFILLELMIALVLSGFVISTMFFAWKYISKHTITQQKKSFFQVEADRIVQSIAQQIRRSPEVMKLTSNSITVLSPGGRDTIVYEFTNGSLRKNNVEVWNDDRSAWITQFSIEKENSELGIDTSSSMTILLTVGLQDRFGNSSVFPLKVRAAIFPERFNRETGGVRGWNF